MTTQSNEASQTEHNTNEDNNLQTVEEASPAMKAFKGFFLGAALGFILGGMFGTATFGPLGGLVGSALGTILGAPTLAFVLYLQPTEEERRQMGGSN